MMAESLRRWLRDEMEAPPSAIPSSATLRRLCSGPRAPIWDFVTRHVRSLPNAKKIRGNVRWYRQLQETKVAPSPPSRQGALRAEVERLRQEVRGLGEAISGAQEVARRLEASLEEKQSQRWAELRRGAELRLLGAEPMPEGLRGDHQRSLIGPAHRPGESRAELSAILALGAEPEVLVTVRALCKAREEELRPRPLRNSQEAPPEAPDWREMAQAALIGRSPGAVLWALETLANESTRELLHDHAPSPEATPTLRSLIQERWEAVGEIWGAGRPLLAELAQLRAELRRTLQRLGSDHGARLSVSRAGLRAFWVSLSRELQSLRDSKNPQNSQKNPQNSPKSSKFSQNSPNLPENSPELLEICPKSLEFAPKCSALGKLRRQLRRGRGRVLQQQQRLRFLSAASRGRRAGLRAMQEQAVGVARAGLGSAPPTLEGEGRRRQLLLGALGALGQPLPPRQAPPPLLGVSRALGLAGDKVQQGALLPRAASLRLFLRQGALSARRGAGPLTQGAGPDSAPPLPPEGGAELLAELRLVGARCQQRIRAWPRLQGLVSQWWAQPAQFALATPPGREPFTHWLQRWRSSALALGMPIPEIEIPEVWQATPTPEVEIPEVIGATPTPESWIPEVGGATPIPEVNIPEVGGARPIPEEWIPEVGGATSFP